MTEHNSINNVHSSIATQHIMNTDLIFTKVLIDNYDEILDSIQKTALDYVNNISTDANYIRCDPKIFLENNEKFIEWMQRNKLNVKDSAIVRIRPNNNNPPHIDDFSSDFILIFPVKNCSDTYTEIYKLPEQAPQLATDQANCDFYQVPYGLEIIGRYSVTVPILLNSKNPHKIYNFTQEDRIAVTFLFDPDPEVSSLVS